MRMLLPVLALMLMAVPAGADLCDTDWLAAATGEEVGRLVYQGADIEEECDANGNRPLHRAVLLPQIDRDVLSTLVFQGADVFAENANGHTPAYYSEARWERARRRFEVGEDAYVREERIRRALDRDFAATVDAHAKLCDPAWWRGAANGDAMDELFRALYVNPNHVCNPDRDRPLHIGLSPMLFPELTGDAAVAIVRLIVRGGNVGYANRSNQTAVSLSTPRYEAAVRQGGSRIDNYCRTGFDAALSVHNLVTATATGESSFDVQRDRRAELCSNRR